MSIYNMIDYLKEYYPNLRGTPWEQVPDRQIIAIYYSMIKREHKKPAKTRYK